MITPDEARKIARDAFPKGPERLVEILKPVVQQRLLGGCDGFCIARGARAVIFLNEALTPKRQRFTLTHELSHLILGVPSIAGETLADMLGSNDDDEKRVNALAAELLIPREVVESTVTEVPVVADVLKRLARASNVSMVAAALRVANLATEIGLMNASVVHFDGSGVKWQWSRTLSMGNRTAKQLLRAARASAPAPFRSGEDDGTVVVASTIDNNFFDTATLFVQLLPADLANNVTTDERRAELESILFADNEKLARSMTGYIGALKNRITGKTVDEVDMDFWERYTETLAETVMNSPEGREYVQVRIRQWF